jgi:hypothetical protein
MTECQVDTDGQSYQGEGATDHFQALIANGGPYRS